ncbi:MAG: S8 family serine peptidase [Anaerolineae bacterium]|nr:S8 family serine peptidase [Anaerolineae bacterium]
MRKLLIVLCILLLLLPATNAQDITTVAGAPATITLNAPEDAVEPLTFIVDALPINGTLIGEAPDFVYQPDAGFVGTDTMMYTVIDGMGIVTSTTLVIQISEDESVAAPAVDIAIEPETTVVLDANGSAAFTMALGEGYEILVEPAHGTLSGQVPDVIYTPDAGFNGEDLFSYSAIVDGAEQTFEVTFAVGNIEGLVVTSLQHTNPAAIPGLSLALTELARPSGLTSLRAEAASFMKGSLVTVIVKATDSAEAASVRITSAGGIILSIVPGYVTADVPVTSLIGLASDSSISYIRLPQRFTTMGNVNVSRPSNGLMQMDATLNPMSGSVVSEAVAYTNASAWHTAGYTGTGVKIGVIDYGFDNYGNFATELSCLVDVKNSDNSAYASTGTVTESGDGIPVIETICDMAPGAQVYARHVETEDQFEMAMNNLAALNVDIIYAALLPVDSDGNAQIGSGDGNSNVDAIVDVMTGIHDIMVVVPAGDNHGSHYEGVLDVIIADINGDGSDVQLLHTFDGEISGWGTDVFNSLLAQDPFNSELNLSSGKLTFVLSWNDWVSETVDLDLFLYKFNTSTNAWEVAVTSAEDSPPPQEVLTIDLDITPLTPGRYRLALIVNTFGNPDPQPEHYESGQWVQLTELQNNVVIFQDRYDYSSIVNPATSQTAFSVGAFYQPDASTRTLDTFSAHGPSNTLNGGDPFSGVGGYFQPQMVANNGTSVSYGGAYTGGFNGTRAAAAHVAGAAALIKQLNPTFTHIDIENDIRIRALQNSGDPGASGPDTAYGYGYLILGNPEPQTCTVDTIGIYRDSNFSWYLRNSNTSGFADLNFVYGEPSDQVITGDWDGDGIDTVGIFRNGTFYLKNDNAQGNADIVFDFGQATDIPIAGDWNGDGIDTIGIYRPSQARWQLRNSNSSGAADVTFKYGLKYETPVTGDWNGDAIDTIGIFRASDRRWYLRNTNTTGYADIKFIYGDPLLDDPITGDWNGDCVDTVGIFRRAEARWYLRNTNTKGFADIKFAYGLANETPVSGDWNNE